MNISIIILARGEILPVIKIADLRKKHKITQKDLAQKINVTQASISRWEDDPSKIVGYNLIKLANFFNVSVDELLGVEENN